MKTFPCLLLALLPAVPTVYSQGNPVGAFEAHADIGAPKIAGSASYDEARQEYLFTAGGTNMWATRDEFQFAWKKLNGDFIVRTRVEFLGPGVIAHRKVGIMVRPNLDADAPYADACEHGEHKLTSLQFRGTKGAISEQIELPLAGAEVLQFERRGKTYIFSAAHFGEPFVSVELKDFDLGDDVFVGLFLCSHNADIKETAVFRDVRIIKPVKPGFTPYRDFIGTTLETLNVFTGRLEALYSSAEPFEAPNWTHDGTALLYNVSGRAAGWGVLRRFDLATKKVQPFDTDFATRNNNDHVFSFDGKQLGISHQGPETNNRSAVYVLPGTGGKPRLVTTKTPSYFHGWSPDGKFLVYAGGRKDPVGSTGPDKYDIYKISVDGGDEVRLTNSPGRSDGPEFSPDGKSIYYNSTRSGTMQLWRMNADGTGHEQLTDDIYHNWFPHLSPDGKWIAFVSFLKDVAPEDHPYYRQIYLRLMPATGGPARIVAYVYGGQGTMNVPSWAPDSRRIAFVSNTDLN